MHKLYRIELEDRRNVNIYYEYAESETEAIAICVKRQELVDVRLKEVHVAKKAEILDAAKG